MGPRPLPRVNHVCGKAIQNWETDKAFFGQKDAAQFAIIRRMVQDLNLPIEIVVCPIVREPDGLALSSRNAYLKPLERKSALVLYRSLMEIKNRFDHGERTAANLIAAGKQLLSKEAGVRPDYLEIVDPSTLEPMTSLTKPALIAAAAVVGTTRLIDNIVLPA